MQATLQKLGLGRAATEAVGELPVRLQTGSYDSTRMRPAAVAGFDQPLVWVVVALLAWGLVMVFSASIALPDNPRFARYAYTHFVTRHGLFIAIGLLAAWLGLTLARLCQ